MKNSIKIIILSFLLLANYGMLFGQQTRIELGDKYFDQYAYKKAIGLYEGAKKRGQNDWSIFAKLGDCYYYTSTPEMAIDNYKQALKKKSTNMDGIRLKYALSMLSVTDCFVVIGNLIVDKDYKTIEVIANYFGVKMESNEIPENFASMICRSSISTDPDVLLKNLNINSNKSDFGGVMLNDTLYFSSSRENPDKKRAHNKRLYKWNLQPYLDIYEAVFYEEIDSSYFKLIPQDSSKLGINTVAHEASLTISNDGKTIYFSGGELKKKNALKYNKRGNSNLKIHRAKLINNKWVIDEDNDDLDYINLENYSVGNPALSPDNKKLFFVTCAPYPNANGQTDIYYIELKDGKIPKKPKIHNLEKVNTEGREMFPFISEDNILYFSSDGVYDGNLPMGLLDIYSYDLNKEDKVNVLGAPYNSRRDDFAYFERSMPDSSSFSKQGYFSSNRFKFTHLGDTIVPKGDDDIYEFNLKRKCFNTISGTVVDLRTGAALEDAIVELIDSTGLILDTLTVNTSGAYKVDVGCDQTFSLRGSNERYYDYLRPISSIKTSSSLIEANLKLEAYPCEISINQIEFDRNSEVISIEAKVAMLPILELLLTNPEIKIRIESHTDSHGTEEYNRVLSQRRALGTKTYLIQAGVNEAQITSAKGFGENCLLNSDEEIRNLPTKEKKEAAHRENRRSRFIFEDCEKDLQSCEDDDPDG